ncbi:MAG: hypothetical protein K2W96_11470, partial [Gemmataceae bacterium]|nr:hypothetical protein [Gemmataceae bacterium]
MPAPLECPECATALKLKSDPVPGKLVRCPQCDHTFRVPEAEDEADSVSEEITEEPRRKPAKKKAETRVATRAAKRRDEDDARPASRKAKRRDDDEEEDEEDEPKKSSAPLIAAVAGVLLLLLGGGAFFLFMRKAEEIPAPPKVADNNPIVKPPVEDPPPDRPPDRPPPDEPPPDRPPVDPPIDPPVRPPVGGGPRRPPDGLFQIKAHVPTEFAEWQDDTQGTAPPAVSDGPDRPQLALDAGAHTGMVQNVLVTRDGKRVITTGTDKAVRIWDVESGETIRQVRMPSGPGRAGALFAAALSPDQKTVAVAGETLDGDKKGHLIYLIDVASGAIRRAIDCGPQYARYLAFSPKGGNLAASGNDTIIRVFQASTGKLLRAYPAIPGCEKFAYSPDGKYLAAVCTQESSVHILPVTSSAGPARGPYRVHKGKVYAAAWSRDSKRIATAGEDNFLRTWSIQGKMLTEFAFTPDAARGTIHVNSLTFLPGDEVLYAGAMFLGEVGIVNVKEGKRRLKFEKHTNTVGPSHATEDGKIAVTSGGEENETWVWETATGNPVKKLAGKARIVCGVGWAADGKSIAWGTINRDIGPGTAPLEKSLKLDFSSSVRTSEGTR